VNPRAVAEEIPDELLSNVKLFEGHLGVKRRKGLELRFFVLYDDRLDYYKSEKDFKTGPLRGRISLDEVGSVTTIREADGSDVGLSFQLQDQTFDLITVSVEDLPIWVGHLERVLGKERFVDDGEEAAFEIPAETEPAVIHEGVLKHSRKGKVSERFVVLLEDCIEYFETAKDRNTGDEPRGRVVFEDVSRFEASGSDFLFFVTGEKKPLELHAKDEQDKKPWLQAFTTALKGLLGNNFVVVNTAMVAPVVQIVRPGPTQDRQASDSQKQAADGPRPQSPQKKAAGAASASPVAQDTFDDLDALDTIGSVTADTLESPSKRQAESLGVISDGPLLVIKHGQQDLRHVVLWHDCFEYYNTSADFLVGSDPRCRVPLGWISKFQEADGVLSFFHDDRKIELKPTSAADLKKWIQGFIRAGLASNSGPPSPAEAPALVDQPGSAFVFAPILSNGNDKKEASSHVERSSPEERIECLDAQSTPRRSKSGTPRKSLYAHSKCDMGSRMEAATAGHHRPLPVGPMHGEVIWVRDDCNQRRYLRLYRNRWELFRKKKDSEGGIVKPDVVSKRDDLVRFLAHDDDSFTIRSFARIFHFRADAGDMDNWLRAWKVFAGDAFSFEARPQSPVSPLSQMTTSVFSLDSPEKAAPKSQRALQKSTTMPSGGPSTKTSTMTQPRSSPEPSPRRNSAIAPAGPVLCEGPLEFAYADAAGTAVGGAQVASVPVHLAIYASFSERVNDGELRFFESQVAMAQAQRPLFVVMNSDVTGFVKLDYGFLIHTAKKTLSLETPTSNDVRRWQEAFEAVSQQSVAIEAHNNLIEHPAQGLPGSPAKKGGSSAIRASSEGAIRRRPRAEVPTQYSPKDWGSPNRRGSPNHNWGVEGMTAFTPASGSSAPLGSGVPKLAWKAVTDELEDPKLLGWLRKLESLPDSTVVHHGVLAVNTKGQVVSGFFVLFHKHMDFWNRPSDAIALQKPCGRIKLADVRSLETVSNGFLLNHKGETLGLLVRNNADLHQWSFALLSALAPPSKSWGRNAGSPLGNKETASQKASSEKMMRKRASCADVIERLDSHFSGDLPGALKAGLDEASCRMTNLLHTESTSISFMEFWNFLQKNATPKGLQRPDVQRMWLAMEADSEGRVTVQTISDMMRPPQSATRDKENPKKKMQIPWCPRVGLLTKKAQRFIDPEGDATLLNSDKGVLYTRTLGVGFLGGKTCSLRNSYGETWAHTEMPSKPCGSKVRSSSEPSLRARKEREDKGLDVAGKVTGNERSLPPKSDPWSKITSESQHFFADPNSASHRRADNRYINEIPQAPGRETYNSLRPPKCIAEKVSDKLLERIPKQLPGRGDNNAFQHEIIVTGKINESSRLAETGWSRPFSPNLKMTQIGSPTPVWP
jgi:hypothetical protein